jgi:hypothetical protein
LIEKWLVVFAKVTSQALNFLCELSFFQEKEKEMDKTEIVISFYYKEKCWIQINHDEINGLDGDMGKHLLDYLNREGIESGIMIKNNYGIIIYREG